MTKNLFKSVGVACGLLIISGMSYQYYQTQKDLKAYQPVGRMVDVGGYKLHMIDSQVGKATVVIDSALGKTTLDWCLVQPEIAKFARVITYDRAGYGWSDVSSLPKTAENMAQQMHTMLHNAKIEPPYILVGDAFGGMNVQLFAALYPQEVAGLILMNPDWHHQSDVTMNPFLLYLTDLANYCGLLRVFELLPSVAKKAADKIAAYPSYLQNICKSQALTTPYIHAVVQESLLVATSLQQLQSHPIPVDTIRSIVIDGVQQPKIIMHAVQNMVHQLQMQS